MLGQIGSRGLFLNTPAGTYWTCVVVTIHPPPPPLGYKLKLFFFLTFACTYPYIFLLTFTRAQHKAVCKLEETIDGPRSSKIFCTILSGVVFQDDDDDDDAAIHFSIDS